jgi:hypothetical protein
MLVFEPKEVLSAACTTRFTTKENGALLGACDLVLRAGKAHITACSLSSGDLSAGEGLLRSALNYAANRGCYIACFSAPDADAVRALLPFEYKNECWCGDIPTLLRGACRGN